MNINAANALLKDSRGTTEGYSIFTHKPQPAKFTSDYKVTVPQLRLSSLTESDLKSALRQINLTIPENDSEIYSLLGSGSVGNSIRLLEHDGAKLYIAICCRC